MNSHLAHNKAAAQEFDTVHKDPSEAWGANEPDACDWDHLEEATAMLSHHAAMSQLISCGLLNLHAFY